MNEVLIKLKIPDEQSMLAFGARLAKACREASVIFLSGQLGAGKTTLTRGFLRGMGYSGHVKSPTYTLVESYPMGERTIYHFDLYRLKDPHELEYMGIQDYFGEKTVCLVEWPEQGAGILPASDLSCGIEVVSQGRQIILKPFSEKGNLILHRFENDGQTI
jgi:tRNA threonylcarbamoyladenosine biosynthesis protein TsaE